MKKFMSGFVTALIPCIGIIAWLWMRLNDLKNLFEYRRTVAEKGYEKLNNYVDSIIWEHKYPCKERGELLVELSTVIGDLGYLKSEKD